MIFFIGIFIPAPVCSPFCYLSKRLAYESILTNIPKKRFSATSKEFCLSRIEKQCSN